MERLFLSDCDSGPAAAVPGAPPSHRGRRAHKAEPVTHPRYCIPDRSLSLGSRPPRARGGAGLAARARERLEGRQQPGCSAAGSRGLAYPPFCGRYTEALSAPSQSASARGAQRESSPFEMTHVWDGKRVPVLYLHRSQRLAGPVETRPPARALETSSRYSYLCATQLAARKGTRRSQTWPGHCTVGTRALRARGLGARGPGGEPRYPGGCRWPTDRARAGQTRAWPAVRLDNLGCVHAAPRLYRMEKNGLHGPPCAFPGQGLRTAAGAAGAAGPRPPRAARSHAQSPRPDPTALRGATRLGAVMPRVLHAFHAVLGCLLLALQRVGCCWATRPGPAAQVVAVAA